MIKSKIVIVLGILLILISITGCNIAQETEYSIIGTWESDSASTITFTSDGIATTGNDVYTYTIEDDILSITTNHGLNYTYTKSNEKEYTSGLEDTWYIDDYVLRLGNNTYTSKT